MRSFRCQCGNTLYFGNSLCLVCHKQVMLCASCDRLASVQVNPQGELKCGGCHTRLRPCQNNASHAVCNGSVVATDPSKLCDYCRLNSIVPDVSLIENVNKWRLLESAKRRVLFDVQRIGFPVSGEGPLPMRFEFKSSAIEPVAIGHVNGVITIDIAEADDLYRERARVSLGEPQRTLVGHVRHELGHYYWDLLVKNQNLDTFRSLFGNEQNPDYLTAQQRYYNQGPSIDWPQNTISAYASMHPWEDFAETFAEYLEIHAILGTAQHFEPLKQSFDEDDFDAMLVMHRKIGILANEFNRDIGLLDLVPEVFTPKIEEKLRYIHNLRPKP